MVSKVVKMALLIVAYRLLTPELGNGVNSSHVTWSLVRLDSQI